jgi:hypothetical protein
MKWCPILRADCLKDCSWKYGDNCVIALIAIALTAREARLIEKKNNKKKGKNDNAGHTGKGQSPRSGKRI